MGPLLLLLQVAGGIAACPTCGSVLSALMCDRLHIKDSESICSYREPTLPGRSWRANATYCGCSFPSTCDRGAHSWIAHTHAHVHPDDGDGDNPGHNASLRFEAGRCRPHPLHITALAAAMVLLWGGCVYACCLRPKHSRKTVPVKAENVPS